jgi:hypothetical protein
LRLAKIAVSGEHAEPDCTSSPETEIFDKQRCRQESTCRDLEGFSVP